MKKLIFSIILTFSIFPAFAANILNIYIWGNYLPAEVAREFTKETGIRLNISEYDNNETMFAKLKASAHSGYDIVVPSSYFVERMRKQNMLEQIDKTRLSNFKNLNPALLNKEFDPNNNYSIPYLWGTTGIIVNTDYFEKDSIKSWNEFWDQRFADKLMILDDVREVFAMAFLTLGYPINDTNPQHIEQTYQKLKTLMPNIKIFNIDAIPNIFIDEDATVGMAWNGDCRLTQEENPKVKYIYPKEGFTIWIDNLAIVKNAPNLANAYKFIDFILRPDIAKKIIQNTGSSSPNLAGIKLLPKEMQQNPVINPDAETLKRGKILSDLDSNTLQLYEKYWEKLKMGE
ncbi:MAG: spermidine/putrescine ABC transporter substrate-binding protein [Gammaproteobacteria bacterium]|nr:spermidine/putrescine ABC transporter substrate-binding protein [Gammaproteobacteria bacterium]